MFSWRSPSSSDLAGRWFISCGREPPWHCSWLLPWSCAAGIRPAGRPVARRVAPFAGASAPPLPAALAEGWPPAAAPAGDGQVGCESDTRASCASDDIRAGLSCSQIRRRILTGTAARADVGGVDGNHDRTGHGHCWHPVVGRGVNGGGFHNPKAHKNYGLL